LALDSNPNPNPNPNPDPNPTGSYIERETGRVPGGARDSRMLNMTILSRSGGAAASSKDLRGIEESNPNPNPNLRCSSLIEGLKGIEASVGLSDITLLGWAYLR